MILFFGTIAQLILTAVMSSIIGFDAALFGFVVGTSFMYFAALLSAIQGGK